MRADPFADSEIEELRARARAGRTLDCPRCGRPLQKRDIPPRRDVSYVRNRLWLVCGPCEMTAVLDLPGRETGSDPEEEDA